MAIHKEYPVVFTARGLSDAWDSTDSFHGACKTLQNLVFDQSNPDLMAARPGVGSPITTFSSFTGATGVTIMVTIGSMIYGMVSTSRLGAFDEPFCYNLLTNTFVAITGTLNTNLPSTALTTGDWYPPTMAVIGVKLIVTHPGFSGTGSNFFGVINLTNPAIPTWTASNTATNALPSVPNAVVNFNNRAYFSCSNFVYYSDVLVPTTMTNAGQSLTVGDTTPVIGISGLPVQTTSAGVVGAIMVFKQYQIWQITGDAAVTGSLSQNFLSLNIGCLSPRSIVQTPYGLFFIGIDGPYYISAMGQVMPLTKDQQKLVQDVQKPFQAIINPSRAAASFSGSIYRVSLKSTLNGLVQSGDYWFDVTTKRWTGPHTFSYDNISPYSNYFIISSNSAGAALFASPYIPTASSTYLDNGSSITVSMQSAFLPKTQNINVKQVVESTMELAAQSAPINYSITAFGEDYSTIGYVSTTSYNPSSLWGTTAQGGNNKLWGTTAQGGSNVIWSTGQGNPKTNAIPWTSPLVFKKVSIGVTALASYSLEIGALSFKYSDTGMTNL